MDQKLVVRRAEKKCWQLLAKIDQRTLGLVKFFKPHGDRLFAALTDGRFIATGDNSYGMLGLGHSCEVRTFEEIPALKNKKIKDIICGHRYTSVLTEDGEVWGWGWAWCEYGLTPRRILDGGIVDVKCGYGHTLALRKDGKVIAWGLNDNGQLGIGSTIDQPSPVYIVSLEGVVVDKIQASSSYSIALCRNGKAFGWGWNKYCQLGVPNQGLLPQPVPINVHNNKSIMAVACSWYYCLYLTRGRQMFVNDAYSQTLRQVWLGSSVHIEHIACFTYGLGSDYTTNPFVAWSAKLCFWGGGGTQHEVPAMQPIPTHLTLSQIISTHCREQAFPSVLYMGQQPENKTKQTPAAKNLLALFNSPKFSDIEFTFPGAQTIKAHRTVLSNASEYMSTQLRTTWKSLSRVSITSHPYSVYYHYLFYLYKRTVSIDDIDQLIALVHLANNHGELHLQKLCVNLLTGKLNVDNCSRVFEVALDLQFEQLEAKACQLLLDNFDQVTPIHAYKNLSVEKTKQLLRKLLLLPKN